MKIAFMNSKVIKKSCYGKNDGEDKISSLPNDILLKILSTLPTKYAVGTSLLSTRWKKVWTSIPNLDICDQLLHTTERTSADPILMAMFMDFVDRVLLLHDASSLNKFHLSCATNTNYGATRFRKWLSTVLNRRVRELIITISLDLAFIFPRCLLSCESLTVLRLDFDFDGILKVPSWVCLPNLKSLYLNFIAICGEQSVQNTVFSFPVMEEFSVSTFRWFELSVVNMYVPVLKRLVVDDYPYHRFDATEQCEINIYANSLTFLKLTSNLECEYSLHNLSCLVDAIVDIPSTENVEGDRMIKLLRVLCNVKTLELSYSSIEILSSQYAFSQLPSFSSLIRLRVIGDSFGFEASCLINLLHKLPNVESLIIEGPHKCKYDVHNMTGESIPRCIVSRLKLLKLGYFNGSELELGIAKFFLKNALALENMFVMSSHELSSAETEKEEVKEKLLLLPRGSTCCVVDLI